MQSTMRLGHDSNDDDDDDDDDDGLKSTLL